MYMTKELINLAVYYIQEYQQTNNKIDIDVMAQWIRRRSTEAEKPFDSAWTYYTA